jgi:hypothetical protein
VVTNDLEEIIFSIFRVKPSVKDHKTIIDSPLGLTLSLTGCTVHNNAFKPKHRIFFQVKLIKVTILDRKSGGSGANGILVPLPMEKGN